MRGIEFNARNSLARRKSVGSILEFCAENFGEAWHVVIYVLVCDECMGRIHFHVLDGVGGKNLSWFVNV